MKKLALRIAIASMMVWTLAACSKDSVPIAQMFEGNYPVEYTIDRGDGKPATSQGVVVFLKTCDTQVNMMFSQSATTYGEHVLFEIPRVRIKGTGDKVRLYHEGPGDYRTEAGEYLETHMNVEGTILKREGSSGPSSNSSNTHRINAKVIIKEPVGEAMRIVEVAIRSLAI